MNCLNESAIWILLEDILGELKGLQNTSSVYAYINPRNIIEAGGRYFLRRGNDIYRDSAEYIYVYEGEKFSWRSDLYSLGVTCLHLLTGVSPLDLYRDGQWIWRDYLLEPVSEFLGKTIDRLLQPERWQSLDEVLTVVKQARGVNYPTMSAKDKEIIEPVSSLSIGSGVTALACGNQSLAVGKSDGTIDIYDQKTRRLKFILKSHDRSVTSLSFSVYGLISGSEDRSIRLWDIDTGQLLRTFSGHTRNVTAVASCQDGSGFISGSWDKTIKLWDLNSGQMRCSLLGHRSQVNCLAVASEWLATGDSDRLIYIWRLSSPPQLWRTLKGHTRSISALTFSADGQFLSSGSADNSIKVWDRASGEMLHTFSGHSWPVVALTFTRGYLLSGSWDKTLKLWDVEKHQLRSTFRGHQDAVTSLTVKDNLILSGGTDGIVNYWIY